MLKNEFLKLSVAVFALLLLAGCGPSGQSDSAGTVEREPSTTSGEADKTDETAAGGGAGAVTTPEVIKEGWGHLKGRFTISGAPQPDAVAITKDEGYCGKHTLVNESLVVGPDGGLANVVVMLSLKRGDKPPTPHESYNAAETATVVLDNLECRFIPRVVLLRTTQTLEVKNSDPDPIAHNTKIEADPPINPILPPGAMITAKFNATRLPAPVSCSIHPWMSAKLVVKESPYMAVTNDKGEFTIENLPSGKWEFQVWQEQLGYVSKVNVGGSDAEWARGQVEVTISGDETTDLGEVKLDFAKYK